jgi:hypothetical protein
LLLRSCHLVSILKHLSRPLRLTCSSFTMASLLLSVLLVGASTTLASPLAVRQIPQSSTGTPTLAAAVPTAMPWDSGAVKTYPIHSSCNRTEAAQISRGLTEAMALVAHAKDHILRWGNSSEIYQKYFGNAPTGEPIGWFDKIANGDKAGVLFRCDNPDGNCGQEGRSKHFNVCFGVFCTDFLQVGPATGVARMRHPRP